MSSLTLNLLGSFEAYLDGEPISALRSSRAQALLIYLTVERSSTNRREYLFTMLWPGMPEKSARHNLSQTLYALRQAFPEVPEREKGVMVPLLLTSRQTIQINPEAAVDLDIHQLDYQLGKAQNHQHRRGHPRETGREGDRRRDRHSDARWRAGHFARPRPADV